MEVISRDREVAVLLLCGYCKGIRKLGIPSAGGTQETNIIPEGDILRLIVKAADQSKNWEIKEKACRFESLIFDEIMPSINKHGGYLTADKIEEVLLNPDRANS